MLLRLGTRQGFDHLGKHEDGDGRCCSKPSNPESLRRPDWSAAIINYRLACYSADPKTSLRCFVTDPKDFEPRSSPAACLFQFARQHTGGPPGSVGTPIHTN